MAQYVERKYRDNVSNVDLTSFTVKVGESDLFVRAQSDLSNVAMAALRDARRDIERWIDAHPTFATSLEPIPVSPEAPRIVQRMCEAGVAAGVGPMAGVAGAVAEHVGRALLEYSADVIVENGGDIFLSSHKVRIVSIFAGDSPLSERMGLLIPPERMPIGVCTSSGTVGPSLSFGTADAAVAVSPNTVLADAVATACGNRVRTQQDVQDAVAWGRGVQGICEVLIIKDSVLGIWGELEIVKLG